MSKFMASIFTRKGEEILVDDEDLELVSQFIWSLDGKGYPRAHVPGSGDRKVWLHKLLVYAPPGWDVDHRNGQKLDAQKHNLESVTHRKNICRHKTKPTTGITQRGANFRVKVGDITIGSFPSFDLALLARIVGEIRYWGEPTQQLP